jgi:hypothetical protein
MPKNNFPKMPTPKFRHPHGRSITIPKHARTRYGALVYFAGITKQSLPDFPLLFPWF